MEADIENLTNKLYAAIDNAATTETQIRELPEMDEDTAELLTHDIEGMRAYTKAMLRDVVREIIALAKA